MLGWSDVVAHQERYEDLRREAERDRLILHELALIERENRLRCRAITWLGGSLVSWGWRLQERYGAELEVPALPEPVAARSVINDRCHQVGKPC